MSEARFLFSATNPCHLFPLAKAIAQAGERAAYVSGYPKWKLGEVPNGLEMVSFPARTLMTYGLLGKVPQRFRPSDAWLYRWQDRHFDRRVATVLSSFSGTGAQCIHAMPGQCLETFRAAKRLGMITVLNHPTGPVGLQLDAVRGEYERVGLPLPDQSIHAEYLLSLEAEEYALADFHCVASSVVKDQLLRNGVAGECIWTVPYGADAAVWNLGAGTRTDAGVFRIVFAGQLSLRKGLRFLLEALELADGQPWQLDVFGRAVGETKGDREAYRGAVPVTYHGAVDQSVLANAFQRADVLVLPSLEEGFGLVVPQALSCGIPCLVSDRVGAKDLIKGGENGDVFACGDSEALARLLTEWATSRVRLSGHIGWDTPARRLIERSKEIC